MPEKPFPTFARLLAEHGTSAAESDFSWTVDFRARRGEAHEAMAPYLAEVERLREALLRQKEKYARLRRSKGKADGLKVLRTKQKATEKEIRAAQAKADAIDAATYDLKAVNPRIRDERDQRAPAEVLESIAKHGSDVDEALKKLRRLLGG